MDVRTIVYKIRQAEADERFLLRRYRSESTREKLESLRWTLRELYTRLHSEIAAVRIREIHRLETLISRTSDPMERLNLQLEERRVQKELMLLNVEDEAARLLSK